MENRKRRSSRALNTLITTIEETRVVNLNEEREVTVEAIDILFNFILRQLKNADPKYSFKIRNLSSIDSENNSVRQFHYFLTWKELSKPTVCQLANDDGYFASVEVLKDPKSWSKYDLDAHLIKIERKRYLNGLSLRDDLIKGLMEVVKNNSHQKILKDLYFQEIEFDQSTIRLIFSGQMKTTGVLTPSVMNNNVNNIANAPANITASLGSFDNTLITQGVEDEAIPTSTPAPQQHQSQNSSYNSKIIYVLNINTMISFTNATPILLNRMKDNLEHHEVFRHYFENIFEPIFYLLPYNPFKWVYDVVYMEHLMFEYILEQKNLFTNAYRKAILIRKSWKKYFQKVFKMIESLKMTEKRENRENRASIVSSNQRDSTMRASLSVLTINDSQPTSLSYQLETAIERTLTEYLFRVIFLRTCAINKNLPDNKELFNSIIITSMFEDLLNITETKFCESFSFKYRNILPKCCIYLDPIIQSGVVRLIKEIHLDWKRGRFGH